MSKVKTVVPQLRFPEFREVEEWEVKPFKKLFSIGNGRDYKHLSAGSVPVYGSGGYMLSVDKHLHEGESVCIGRKGTINNPMFLTGKFWTVDTLFYTHSFQQCLPKFVFAIFQSIDWLKHNEAGGVPSLSKANIEKIETPIPRLPEQQKIADCLSSVDELIAAQARKLDALKTHKKGLMQQLFPREGETQPYLRFPEFQDKREWDVRALGSLASFSSGGTPSKDNPQYWNGSIPWVSASSMYEQLIFKANHYVTPLAISNGTRIAKKGAILILVRGSMLFKRVPLCIAGIDVAFNQDVKALDVGPSIDCTFLLYQLSAFESRIPINETGIGAGKIDLADLKGFELFIPSQLEQQRIANCLTSLDDLIAAQTQQLEALKTHKKGLMQQLFPSAEVVEA